ncbi:MAG: Cytosol aminopeptidase [Chlamydiales bacterium]|nr:Cytosol aminopeptidase [Chlamydiales bacterium]MCH9635244.1 Cytosol aminopeptidase [Chlamydiales bacterium]
MTPQIFASRCQKLDLDVEVLAPLPAIEAVGRAGNPPALVVMHYKGADEDPLVLIGKGVCFDAGGLNLKRNFLNQMHRDKAGAAAVCGIMQAVSKLKPKKHIIGIVGLAENLPGKEAIRPGDVITMLDGTTVEVKDPDAEGRLILADCISYAQQRFKPAQIIDLATLTLETFGALADEYAGLFCNCPKLTEALQKAGPVWPLPLGESFRKQLSSKRADLSNDGRGQWGASSVAAEFLHYFVSDDLPWAHLDISGMAWDPFEPDKGVSGFGVDLICNFIFT